LIRDGTALERSEAVKERSQWYQHDCYTENCITFSDAALGHKVDQPAGAH